MPYTLKRFCYFMIRVLVHQRFSRIQDEVNVSALALTSFVLEFTVVY
jgi:hypothetical protein